MNPRLKASDQGGMPSTSTGRVRPDPDASPPSSSPAPWRVEVFFDGDCPLCRREISSLRRLDRRKRIRFTDIARPGFEADGVGVDFEELMARIHGRLPDGTIIEGVEVFRRLYSAVGLGPLVWITRCPGISHLLELGYRFFARNRLRWTGRCEEGRCQASGTGATAE